ncbi:MAG: hypothetical protein ACKOTB_13570, partial [Planctomycetia bacterium]
WRRFVDTSRTPPDDVCPGGAGPLVDPSVALDLPERSLVCFVADPVAAAAPKRLTFEPDRTV